MSSAAQAAAAVKALNPFLYGTIRRKLFYPSPQKISVLIDTINSYLRENFQEQNITCFDMDTLSHIFSWENKLNDTALSISRQAIKYIQDGDTVFDIGANVGLFSLDIAKKKNVQMIMFEPVPMYRDYCRLVSASYPSVEVVGKALSDTTGTATIFMDSDNLGWNTLVKEKVKGKMSPVEVETITLDDFMNQRPEISAISCMKIDVEGAEYRVFKGAHKAFAQIEKKPVLLLEIGWGKNHPYRNEEVCEFEWLINNGYARFEYDFDVTQDVIILPDA